MSAENVSIIAADFESQLSASIAVGATSFVLQSVTDSDGVALSDGIYAFTIDRDSRASKEYFIGQLTAGTKTVSSISSVSRQGTLTANAQRSHRIGANVIMSDHSVLAALSKIFRGVGKINPAAPLEYDTAPTLSAATQIATKGYVDSVVTGGTVNTDRIILGSQTAGETVEEGEIIYFKSSDSRWWLADADLTATFSNVQLGVAQGAGTAGNPIAAGVLIYGKSDNFTGLTATATYYLSNTAGGVATSAGTNSVILGQAFATTGIFFNPKPDVPFFVTTSAGAGDVGKGVKLNASGELDESFIPILSLPTLSTTYTRFHQLSDTVEQSNDSEKTTTSTSFVKIKETQLNENLSLARINFDAGAVWGAGSHTNADVALYRNGVLVQNFYVGTSSYSTRTVDFAGGLSSGDLIQLYARRSGNVSSMRAKNLRICYDSLITKINGLDLVISILSKDPSPPNATNNS